MPRQSAAVGCDRYHCARATDGRCWAVLLNSDPAHLPGMRPSPVDIGQSFRAVGNGLVWRVERHLADGIHVVIARDDDRSRRKTISIWALLQSDQFSPLEDQPSPRA